MTKETGLLRDLNLKPGDRVTMDLDPDKEIMKVVGVNDSESFPDHFRLEMEDEGCGLYSDSSGTFTIISRAPTPGPVRTVTKKEIVPGVYGHVKVDWAEEDLVVIGLKNNALKDVGTTGLSKDELSAVITTLTEIREAL